MELSPVSEIPALILIVLSCFFIGGIIKLFKLKQSETAYPNLDALRGYLSIFIVLYHSTIYFWFKKKGTWVDPPSNFFNELGDISILLFLMISGFLFFNFLDKNKGKAINWGSFYFRRILKLFPLFLLFVITVVIVCFSSADYKLTQTPMLFLNDLLHLLCFSIFRTPELNNFSNIQLLNANALFVFKYFWLFYLSLPLVARIFYKIKTPLLLIVFSSYIIIKILYQTNINFLYILPFFVGLFASFAVNNQELVATFKTKKFTIINLIILVVLFSFSQDLNIIVSFLLISYLFIVIVCGNTLFGALKSSAAAYIGKMAYPIFLIHPLLLYFIYDIGTDKETMQNLHWLMTVLILTLSFIAGVLLYNFILKPALQLSTNKITANKFLKYGLAIIIVIAIFSINQFYEPKIYCKSFENEPIGEKNVLRGKAYSGNYCYVIDSLHFTSPSVNANLMYTPNSRKIYASAFCSAEEDTPANLELITCIKYKDSVIVYRAINVAPWLYVKHKWIQVEDSIVVPLFKEIESSNVFVYLRSDSKKMILVDDLFLKIK